MCVCVCVYWPSCPLSWLLIKRLLYAEESALIFSPFLHSTLSSPGTPSLAFTAPFLVSLALSVTLASSLFRRLYPMGARAKMPNSRRVISCSDMKTLGALGLKCGLKRRTGAFHHALSPRGNKEITYTRTNSRPNLHLFLPVEEAVMDHANLGQCMWHISAKSYNGCRLLH